LKALASVPDEGKVYIMTTRSVIEMATAGARGNPDEVYFAIGASVQQEVGGISLIADFVPA
jgi:hypothetical protein